MVKVYDLPYYHKLKWSERKLLRGKPFIVVEYLKDNETQYEVGIYQVEKDNLSYMQALDKLSGRISLHRITTVILQSKGYYVYFCDKRK